MGPPRPGRIIERHEVLEELGAGAMGRVYLVRDPRLERRCAFKV